MLFTSEEESNLKKLHDLLQKIMKDLEIGGIENKDGTKLGKDSKEIVGLIKELVHKIKELEEAFSKLKKKQQTG